MVQVSWEGQIIIVLGSFFIDSHLNAVKMAGFILDVKKYFYESKRMVGENTLIARGIKL